MNLSHRPLVNYAIITGNYWAFTLTDGALRMLVLLYFHQLGYSPLDLALLFVLYEFLGVVTNLLGGYLGARLGLNLTMNLGMALQLIALGMLLVDDSWLTLLWVMAAQGLSGIAKDLNKMSAKSAIKSLATEADGQVFRWVAYLTGSKNALKGVGFFLGAWLLDTWQFNGAIQALIAIIFVGLLVSSLLLQADLGKAKNKPKFSQILSKSAALNWLSASRFFLFGARDVWFVIALPLYLASQLAWSFAEIGGFLALWVIGYGFVQGLTPSLLKLFGIGQPNAMTALGLALLLAMVPLGISANLFVFPTLVVVLGLAVFGVFFALNSAVHSYLIVHIADADGTAKDVGFYYMANAGGRLLGTLLSGWIYQAWGLEATLWASTVMVLLAGLLVIGVKTQPNNAERLQEPFKGSD